MKSLKAMYDDGFLRFCSWAAEQAFDPFGPFAAQVALLSRTHGLPRTIQGYSSSKPSVPSRFGKGPIWCITTSLPLILYPLWNWNDLDSLQTFFLGTLSGTSGLVTFPI